MRFRPRFSVRTLVILVSLFCAYLAAWIPTKRAAARIGSPDNPTPWILASGIRGYVVVENAHSPVPFVISQVEWEPGDYPQKVRRQYYLWFFDDDDIVALPFWTHYTPRPDDGQTAPIYRDSKTGRLRSAPPAGPQPLP
jgi:hypothetical protein